MKDVNENYIHTLQTNIALPVYGSICAEKRNLINIQQKDLDYVIVITRFTHF